MSQYENDPVWLKLRQQHDVYRAEMRKALDAYGEARAAEAAAQVMVWEYEQAIDAQRARVSAEEKKTNT